MADKRPDQSGGNNNDDKKKQEDKKEEQQPQVPNEAQTSEEAASATAAAAPAPAAAPAVQESALTATPTKNSESSSSLKRERNDNSPSAITETGSSSKKPQRLGMVTVEFGSTSKKQQRAEIKGPPYYCFVCGQGFPSWHSLFGHMRKHPDRGWRGVFPPSTFNPEDDQHENPEDDQEPPPINPEQQVAEITAIAEQQQAEYAAIVENHEDQVKSIVQNVMETHHKKLAEDLSNALLKAVAEVMESTERKGFSWDLNLSPPVSESPSPPGSSGTTPPQDKPSTSKGGFNVNQSPKDDKKDEDGAAPPK